MTREIRPATTTSASDAGRWLDEYVAYTSWAMRVLARSVELNRRAGEHTEVCP